MSRLLIYVDAYNLYHAMRDESWPNYLKWSSYARLGQLFAQGEETVEVKVFTALANHFPGSLNRQRLWIAAQQAEGCQVILGNFKKKNRSCKSCGTTWVGHEEKETDVNLAIHLINDSWRHPHSRQLVLTNDTDIRPALVMLRQANAERAIGVSAIGRIHPTLDQIATFRRVIKMGFMRQALMPAEIQGAHSLIKRPEEYAPPPEIRVPER